MLTAPNIRPRDWGFVALLGFTWGANFLVTEVALRGITPYWLAASRIMVAAFFMAAIWRWRGGKLWREAPSRTDWLLVAFIGATSTSLPFLFIAWGQQHVTAGFAGVCMASVALIVLPLAHVLVPGETMSWRKTLGLVIGFIGVTFLIGTRAFDSSGAALEYWGRAACLGGACCYAVSSIAMRKLSAIDPIGLAACVMTIGALISAPVALTFEGIPAFANLHTLAIVVFLGLVPTALALLIQFDVVRNAGPVFMSLVNYQVPIWAVVLGAWLLSEPLPSGLLLGLVLILMGVALSQWGALKRLFIS